MSTVGSRIRRKRQELGISADELAAMLGKNRATIYRYESDDIENLPISVIGPLATALHVSPSYLMGWSSYETNEWTNRFRKKLRDILNVLDTENLLAAGVNMNHLADIASGDCSLSFPEACSIADELGLSLDEMVGLKTEEPAPNDEGGLDMKIINLILSLPENKKYEAENYIRYLAGGAEK